MDGSTPTRVAEFEFNVDVFVSKGDFNKAAQLRRRRPPPRAGPR
ncbi:hypothetical protein [Streptomyces macrosporus]